MLSILHVNCRTHWHLKHTHMKKIEKKLGGGGFCAEGNKAQFNSAFPVDMAYFIFAMMCCVVQRCAAEAIRIRYSPVVIDKPPQQFHVACRIPRTDMQTWLIQPKYCNANQLKICVVVT